MHIHARSKAEQSAVSQSAVSQGTESLNRVFERTFERAFERLCGLEAGSDNTFECTGGSEAGSNSTFERTGSSEAGSNSTFERTGGPAAGSSSHFECQVAPKHRIDDSCAVSRRQQARSSDECPNIPVNLARKFRYRYSYNTRIWPCPGGARPE